MKCFAVPLLLSLFHAAAAGADVPQVLAEALTRGGIPAADLRAVETEPQAWIYEKESRGRQVTVIGLAKVPTAPQTIARDLTKRNGLLKTEALRQIGVFSTPPKPADVAKYRMPESSYETLADCELGDCKFKLSKNGLANLEKIDWSKPDAHQKVDALMQKGMVEFVRRYQQSGREALGVAVDKETPQSFAKGADTLTAQLGLSTQLVPALRDHLLHYPHKGIDGARDRILWTVRDYGYRPVTSVVHSIMLQPPEGLPVTLIALKTLYAAHYFHARQRLIGLWADGSDPDVTYVSYGDRLLFDDDVGSIKRRMLQAGIVENAAERLGVLRSQYE